MFNYNTSKKIRIAGVAALSFIIVIIACKTQKSAQPKASVQKAPRVLVFSKTKGWYHESIPSGIAALQKLGRENNIIVDTTKNSNHFVEDSLKNYSAVIFLSTTQNVLNADQQVAFERYIQAGGGFVGIHAAADTEYDWPWYNKLVGAYFKSHPNNSNVRKATVDVIDTTHIANKGLPARWERTDEWYNYKSIFPGIKVIAKLDETTYEGGENGRDHPIAWYHDFDGGRAFYTGGGHTNESYLEPLFLKHLLGGIKYAIGSNAGLDLSKAYSVKTPEENRFTKTVLSNDLNEPMELAVAPDGKVFFVERTGKFYMYDPATNKTKLVRDFPVKAVNKYLNGLLGMTIDPDYAQNHFLYFFNTVEENGQTKQNISRFVFKDDNTLDLESEKVIIQVPIELEVSAHTGGSMAWDKDKNLYISTGDNTVPFESDGFAPIDERQGRITFDARRSSGNTNDLRGKILRIHPQADGTYTVPEGNLFPKGTAGTRPEIYVMGCRNPYRISVDSVTSIVYWGEVGPDSGTDGKPGPRGYDEFNQAKKAGNYGWPFFVGDSKPYYQFSFATKEVGPLFEVNAPVNNSALNTGLKTLPPTQKAMVWYPYNKSEQFIDLGEGGRCAMGGPVYNYQASLNSPTKFPEYFDKALFMYDWMRNWVFAVRLDENQNYKRLEQFMPISGDFRRPADIEFGPNGVMYMLEYGSVYGIDNTDARLVRIDFNRGNRAPIAKIRTKDSIGIAPYKVEFSSKPTKDFDEDDKLTYEWKFDGKTVGSTEANPTYTFAKNGVYKAVLKVSDPSGAVDTDTIDVKVGNTPPQVAIETPDNSSFFFAKPATLKYAVKVKDNEEKATDPKRLKVSFSYLSKVAANKPLVGHQEIPSNFSIGKSLIAGSDCKACHQLNGKSVGPSFIQVSEKFANDPTQVKRLANKIITGGGGVWGEHAMSAHPQLSVEETTDMVKYILSLSDDKEKNTVAPAGTLTLKDHLNQGEKGRYLLTASYTDNGGAITPLSGSDMLMLRPAKVWATEVDERHNIDINDNRLGSIHNDSYFILKDIDLKDIDKLTYRYSSKNHDAAIEVRADSPKGELLSKVNYTSTGDWSNLKEISTPLKRIDGRHNLYFIFKKEGQQHIGSLAWVSFEKSRNIQPETPAVKSGKSNR